MSDLSVLIPARNERWLSTTVEDVCKNIKGDTEVIIVLDGAWPEPGYELKQHANVHVIYLPEAIGQRAATNLAARISTSKYIMKLDGHCAVASGFDVELIESARTLGRDCTQIPAQYNLHVFDWVCKTCGRHDYQGPTPTECRACSSKDIVREVVWNAKRRRTEYWRFDSDLHFQYWSAYGERPEAQGEIVDIMTSLGACFFMERERFWELGGLDEAHGSWGQFGVEIALKSWLSGGRHVVNKRTWFSHMFRTQGGDFSFPYPISGHAQEAARVYSRNLWLGDKWPNQVRTLRWLLDKFVPVPGWSQEQIDGLPRELPTSVARRSNHCDDVVVADRVSNVTKGIVYYTDNRLDEKISRAVQMQLSKTAPGSIVAVTCGDESFSPVFENCICIPEPRGYLTMFKQILAGLEALDTEYVFLCEHDVLYHPSHFDFMPPRDDTYYYNQNVWKVDASTKQCLHYLCSQTSGLCANRRLLVEHYRKRVALVEQGGYTRGMGFEPGTHGRPQRVDDFGSDRWMSAFPNIDIRHDKNLTSSRWKREQFRNQKYTAGWTEARNVSGWPPLEGRSFTEFLQEVAGASILTFA